MAKNRPLNGTPSPSGQNGRAVVRHLRDLTPDPENRRKHNPRNLGMVVDALHQVGAARSIVIDEDNVILAGFPEHTVAAFEAAGARKYNEAILVTAVGSLPIRAAKAFETSRKLGKTHQNVLVFCKGDPRRATEAIGPVECGEVNE